MTHFFNPHAQLRGPAATRTSAPASTSYSHASVPNFAGQDLAVSTSPDDYPGFAHIECYARQAARSKTGKTRFTAFDVAAEAERKQGHCPHVSNPQPAQLLYGLHPTKALAEWEKRLQAAGPKPGRKYRVERPVMLAAVFSFPRATMAQLASDPQLRKAFLRWRRLVAQFVVRWLGDNLMCIIQHNDETYPHLHVMALPPIGSDGSYCVDDIHPGRSAGKQFKAAMSAWQDNYYDQVSNPCEHGRGVSGGQHYSRNEWQARKADAARAQEREEQEVELLRRREVFWSELRDARQRVIADFQARIDRAKKQAKADAAAKLAEVERDIAIRQSDAMHQAAKLLEDAGEIGRAIARVMGNPVSANPAHLIRLRSVLADLGVPVDKLFSVVEAMVITRRGLDHAP